MSLVKDASALAEMSAISVPPDAPLMQQTAEAQSFTPVNVYGNYECSKEDHRKDPLGLAREPTPPQTRAASPARVPTTRPHAEFVQALFRRLNSLRNGTDVILDGKSLDIPSVVAVANYNAKPRLDDRGGVIECINASVDLLATRLREGEMVYGVNTGFGGSADVRTNKLKSLQKGLVQHQNSAILTSHDVMEIASFQGAASDVNSNAMPTSWVRGLMLSRCNSIIRGHSAVSVPVVQAIITFLEHEITPIIPKRGSISASGDLIPLSYLAGALQGNPDIFVQIKTSECKYQVVSSNEALRMINMTPIVLGAKEGLGLLNGTAASASVASLALYECNYLALLSQIITGMGCEAMRGTAESFHPFIASTRPHRGQIEAAANILGFLSGSRLAQGVNDTKKVEVEGLAQDRYTFRTASQWIGPQLEDLMLANEQVAIELNSTTDNPLVDINSNHIRHGGNFQAASITSAMEKARLALSMIAKLLFAQTTEIINPAMNRGLPPNLCADDPSVSFMAKGIDITMAAYYSEIAFLSNPVSTHVQSAEMHNQAVNSLALVSARYTLDVVDILSQMCAAYLVMVCQALDLRVLQERFLSTARTKFAEMTKGIVDELSGNEAESSKISTVVWNCLAKEWDATTTIDLTERARKTAETASAALVRELRGLSALTCSVTEFFEAIETWTNRLSDTLQSLYESSRQEMFQRHVEITPTYLGQGSGELYRFVRGELDIPFHRGLVDCPTFVQPEEQTPQLTTRPKKTIGSHISKVYEAITSGTIHASVMAAVEAN
ncbi:phenylalanine ammonia-lyase [Verruconis gallopava]|uniref:Phenylalanine ammonia-lyase n=1 Tax=Verruconis gallopava TaxID=253628 RepID=A0A0D2AQA3_9PEZI|nr:phenylalanine ammonia-lyase [Verruconis gallopava]KIW08690.1 phenylalanine ammonia-lyase [Verruconis gallopava]